MHMALYRDFRPETFDSVIGQEHIVKILKNQIHQGTVSHAYLFCGTRGTGKTTTARILAKGVNCLNEENSPCGICVNCTEIQAGTFIDVLEIDAASNNGVENIRELKESVKYPPVKGKNKVYIIDEVHMLSTGAFNALLKTLEEPPENVIFILATTEPQKLPATILSRCLRLDFRRVAEPLLVENMKRICQEKHLETEESALALIAANADGSVRDSLSLLERCIAMGQNYVNREDVINLLGISGEDVFLEITDLVLNKQVSEALLLLNKTIQLGKDVKQFIKDWVGHFRNLLVIKYMENPANSLNMSVENIARVKEQSERISLDMLNRSILELSKVLSEAKWSTQPRVLLELAIVQLSVGMAVSQQSFAENYINSNTPQKPKKENKPVEADVLQPLSEDVTEKKLEVPVSSDDSLEAAWEKVFEELCQARNSFVMFANSVKLAEITEKTFTLSAADTLAKRMFSGCKGEVEEIMERMTGVKRIMKFSDEEAIENQAGNNRSDIGKQIQEKFNVRVEYKED